MSKSALMVLLGLALAGPSLPALDVSREFSYVVDNWTPVKQRVVIEERLANGKPHVFDKWIDPGASAGFNLANGNVYRRRTSRTCALVRMKLDTIDTNKWFNTVDMNDMFGNSPRKEITGPAHFLVKDNKINVFPCSLGKGRK